MIINFFLAIISGLLVAKVCSTSAATGTITLYNADSNILGKKGRLVANVATILLPYALCSSYVVGVSDQIAGSLKSSFIGPLPTELVAVGVTCLFSIIILAGAGCVDWVNRVLFGLQLATLAVVIALLFPGVQ